jgi:hypothetical protein
MHETEYLKKHHAITEQAIGSIHLMLLDGRPEKAMSETVRCIDELDVLSEHYKINSTAYMIKVVLRDGDWKKEGGLYRSHRLGIRNLKAAFDIVQAKVA